MSYIEAQDDGVRIESRGSYTRYYPLCVFCGRETLSLTYIRRTNYLCPVCRPYKKTLVETGLLSRDERK